VGKKANILWQNLPMWITQPIIFNASALVLSDPIFIAGG
jgi:hypothetical protein